MLTETQYAETRARINAYNAWSEQYKDPKSGWTCIPADAVPPVKVTNEERSAVEVYEFMRDKPKAYFVYVKRVGTNDPRVIVTTWTGDELGTGKLGAKRDSGNFPIEFKAVNGLNYKGTYYAKDGDYARVKAKEAA